MEEEIWFPIAGYEGKYQVSNLGRVRSLDYRRTGRTQVLKPAMDGGGYLYVNLCKDGKPKGCSVHHLVAEAFLDNPLGLAEVNHKDECKTNNSVDNLEWCDRLYNVNYGTGITRRAAAKSKLVEQLSKDGTLVAVWPSMAEAERTTGVYKPNIWKCCNGKYRSAGGFKWRYVE